MHKSIEKYNHERKQAKQVKRNQNLKPPIEFESDQSLETYWPIHACPTQLPPLNPPYGDWSH